MEVAFVKSSNHNGLVNLTLCTSIKKQVNYQSTGLFSSPKVVSYSLVFNFNDTFEKWDYTNKEECDQAYNNLNSYLERINKH